MRSPTEAELDRLEAVAATWVGTPFCPNSAVKGGGVSCHNLPAEIYFEAGWLERFPVAEGSPLHGRAGAGSLMEYHLDRLACFTDADPGRLCLGDGARAAREIVQPGDLVCSRPARLPYHLALALRRGRFIHVQYHGLTHIAPNLPPVWAARLARIYRPKLHEL